jgi:hypothetical protein
MTARRQWTTKRLYFTSLGVYAASFLLPAVINTHPTPYESWVEMWGWQAAQISLATPMALIIGPSNLGYVAASVLIAMGSPGAAIAGSAVALVSMAFCGIILPAQAHGDWIRWPGGLLGPGYFAWLAAGVMMLLCSVRTNREARVADRRTLGITEVRP